MVINNNFNTPVEKKTLLYHNISYYKVYACIHTTGGDPDLKRKTESVYNIIFVRAKRSHT